MANAVHDQSALRNFRFDTRDVDWKDFITAGCYYKLLDVNVGARTADMIVKFDPGARCMYHRHVAPCTSLILEGELHIIDQTSTGEKLRVVKPAGTFTSGVEDDMHVEGGGDNGVRVARSPAPHCPHTTEDQAHSRLISAITAPQTPR